MENLADFKVRNIVTEGSIWSRVTVNIELFKMIALATPLLPFVSGRDSKGEKVRIFDIAGTTVISKLVRDAMVDGKLVKGSPQFFMKNEDIPARLESMDEFYGNSTVADLDTVNL